MQWVIYDKKARVYDRLLFKQVVT